ncbi:MAG: hypothetical protein IKV36_05240 [Clostridia bacterium]|nr:hypothetical protein [Clostridia bacterium]
MDINITEKLTELLNNPEGIDKIKSVASSLFSEKENPTEKNEETANNILSDIDPMMIMKIMSSLNNSENDNRANLLLALKPHLSKPRQERVDSAVKLLKLIPLLPLVKQIF